MSILKHEKFDLKWILKRNETPDNIILIVYNNVCQTDAK